MALTKSQEARAKKSQKYWQDREAEQLKHNITEEKEFEKQLNRIYREMLEKVENDIYSFYGKYAEKEGITIAEAKKRVLKADIETLERKAKKYVRDAAKDRRANFGKTDTEAYYFSEEANEEMRLYNLTMKVNRLEMLKANIGIELIDGHSKLEKFMSEILQDRTEAEMERQAGILGKSVQDNAQAAKTIVNASFHNATFSERIWLNQKLLKAEINKQLQSGLIRGKNPKVLAKDIRKQFDVSKYNAERLMRTELARVQTEAQKESFIKNDFEMYTFHVNSGCCQICSGLNGKHFKIKDMMPGTNAPPMHPNCRCSISAYEDSEEYEAWLDYLDKGGTTEEWNKIKNKYSSKSIVKSKDSGIIKAEREMANGMRKSFKIPLSENEKNFIRKEIEEIGATQEVFVFRDGLPTGYSDERDIIFVSSSVFPSNDGSTHPTDRLSVRATLAHEYYGHRVHRNTKLPAGAWNDEFRASYSAAKNCPNLTDEDRASLIADAIERANKAGVTIKLNSFMRRCLYGYE